MMERSHWQGSIPLLMERADGADLDVDRARHEAADAIEMLLDRSLRPTHQGIGARLFLTTVRHMLHEMRRTADVHARGPWLPPRVHARDGGPPPFGPATLTAWNLACAPGLRVSSRMRNSPGTFVGSPRSLHFSADEFLERDTVGVMRTMPALMELVRD